ncbi:MAG: hypothetical protein JWR05_432 [Mucilaginibacter sp.]|nr:hypothetical protein [Mucilaginibacter sp.]
MQLKKGIKLHSLASDGYDSVFINSGTIPADKLALEKVDFGDFNFTPLFRDNAYVPKKDWKCLNRIEIKAIQSNDERRDYNTIYIGDTSDNLKGIFRRLEIEDLKSRQEVMSSIKEKPELIKELSREMQRFLLHIANGKPFHFHCIAANLPNLEMVACDVSKLPPNFTVPQKKYNGLHNDGTKFMSIHSTYKYGNRITINLGKQSRIFYFINLTLIQVINMLKQQINVKEHNVNVHNIAACFFKYFPDYPVIKLIQKPYQYYIAPTDNCFHDGSTLGNAALDINMVYFGSFKC